jgi:hypothetical protein
MTDSDSVQHLLTRYVFIDTEAFRKARFDWTGRMLSKLVEFAKQGHLRLLTTEVTKREITSRLRELLADAAAALKKHEIVLRQAGAGLSRTIVSRCAGQSLPVGHSAISIAPTASFAISLASAPSGRAAQGRYCTISNDPRPAAAALSRTIATARAV